MGGPPPPDEIWEPVSLPEHLRVHRRLARDLGQHETVDRLLERCNRDSPPLFPLAIRPRPQCQGAGRPTRPHCEGRGVDQLRRGKPQFHAAEELTIGQRAQAEFARSPDAPPAEAVGPSYAPLVADGWPSLRSAGLFAEFVLARGDSAAAPVAELGHPLRCRTTSWKSPKIAAAAVHPSSPASSPWTNGMRSSPIP
jgi:hypothetical protein